MRGHGGDAHRLPCRAENLGGKLRPRAEALVGCVIDAVLLRCDHIGEQRCKVMRVGRRADLIADDGETLVLLREIQHGLDEVLAVDAEHP